MVRIVPVRATVDVPAHGTSQTIAPFEEVMPSVYLYWQWWNETYQEDGSTVDSEWDEEPGDDWEEGPLALSDEDAFYYFVMDNDGNGYWIMEDVSMGYYYSWTWNNLLVSIIADPDGSYVSWLAEQDVDIESDIWFILYESAGSALSGDEVVVFSGFYYADSYMQYQFNITYNWYDEEMNPVNPFDVIPNLAPGYEWAALMNGSTQDSFEWSYKGFGYDVHEMTVVANQTHWMEHYFMGLTAFNDTNGNGILDLVYSTIAVDFDEDGQNDWYYQVLNESASESYFVFYSDDAQLGSVETPHLNSDGQIEWGAEVVNISGSFYSPNYWEYEYDLPEYDDFEDFMEGDEEMTSPPTMIPVTVDSLSMTYRFEMTDTSAVLKIDQHVGDFRDPSTGDIVPDLMGLSLALTYWSWFSTYNLTVESGDEIVLDDDDHDDFGEWEGETPEVPTEIEPEPIVSGGISFDIQNETLASVDFGGTYVWGWDGQTYDVGTAVYPIFGQIGPVDDDLLVGAFESEDCNEIGGGVYYYSSFYKNWDGYSITHDPIFQVYPDMPPGEVSSYVSNVLTASTVFLAGGTIALVVVLVRIHTLRKRE